MKKTKKIMGNKQHITSKQILVINLYICCYTPNSADTLKRSLSKESDPSNIFRNS